MSCPEVTMLTFSKNNTWNTNSSEWLINSQTVKQYFKLSAFAKATATTNISTNQYAILCYYQTKDGYCPVVLQLNNKTATKLYDSNKWQNTSDGKYMCISNEVTDCTFYVNN